MTDSKRCMTLKIWWTSNLWTKWQIVIPKEVRDALNINPWDNMLILFSPEKKHIWIVKNDDFQKIIDYAKAEWVEIQY